MCIPDPCRSIISSWEVYGLLAFIPTIITFSLDQTKWSTTQTLCWCFLVSASSCCFTLDVPIHGVFRFVNNSYWPKTVLNRELNNNRPKHIFANNSLLLNLTLLWLFTHKYAIMISFLVVPKTALGGYRLGYWLG